MRFIHTTTFAASIALLSTTTKADTVCSAPQFTNIALLPVTDATNCVFANTSDPTRYNSALQNCTASSDYPITGNCSSSLATAVNSLVTSDCNTCISSDKVNTAFCSFCGYGAAIKSTMSQSPNFTNTSCTGNDATILSTMNVTQYASCVNSTSDASSCTSSWDGVSESCLSCLTYSYAAQAADCTTTCAADLSNTTYLNQCLFCQQTQYLTASSLCVVSSSAFSSIGGLMISTFLMVGLMVFGL